MTYKLVVMILDEGSELVSSSLPFADLDEAQAAYRRAVGSATGANPFEQMAEVARKLEKIGQCRAVKYPVEGPPITCVRPRGHEARREKHLGPGVNGEEWT